jgi:hypothetical protein
MMQKVRLSEIFVEWFKQTNPHLHIKGVTKKEREKELNEYVNDVLYEHMEMMANYDIVEPTGPEDSEE